MFDDLMMNLMMKKDEGYEITLFKEKHVRELLRIEYFANVRIYCTIEYYGRIILVQLNLMAELNISRCSLCVFMAQELTAGKTTALSQRGQPNRRALFMAIIIIIIIIIIINIIIIMTNIINELFS